VVALGLLAAAAASVAFNVGVILQAADARQEPAEEGLRLSLLAHLVRRRRWVAGLLLGAVGFGLQVLPLLPPGSACSPGASRPGSRP
jgi:hypothetical protein